LLTENSEGLTRVEISERLSLARATTYRTLTALTQEGLILADRGRFRIGSEIGRFASSMQHEFIQQMRPHLESLSRNVNETVYLAKLDVTRTVLVDQISSTQSLRVVSPIGVLLPLHATASGKAILAQLVPSQAEDLLSSKLERLTAATKTNRRKVLAEIGQIRVTGVAWNRDEYSVGISALASALVESPIGPIAVGIQLPSIRVAGREGLLSNALLAQMARIQSAFRLRRRTARSAGLAERVMGVG
jgi:DNA-binding IclR family transcriptional regulator